jgi:hypothetical protein
MTSLLLDLARSLIPLLVEVLRYFFRVSVGARRCRLHHMNTPLPKTEEAPGGRIRLTITVTPEVHAAFSRLAAASGQSLSRSMGDWLQDTLEAADFAASMMEKARQAPKMVMREMHAYALGLADETGSLLERVRSGRSSGAPAGGAGAPVAGAGEAPRLVIRGGKSPGKTLGRRGGKANG